jgi:hypothetical protein
MNPPCSRKKAFLTNFDALGGLERELGQNATLK